ncbi:chemotaxis protein, partial [Arcobacter sp. CECT 9188]
MFFNNSNMNILNLLDSIEAYLKNDINNIDIFQFNCSGYNKKIKYKLDSICNLLNKKNDDELLIYGEIMLVCEKIEKGMIGDKIYHLNSQNIKLNYIAKTINSLVNILHDYINQTINILSEYSQYNYLRYLDTNLVHNDFQELFDGINTLREMITKMLIENKSNGLTLDESSNILLENVDKLNISSNEAAARLEETAAAIE